MLSCLYDGVYKITLAANRKEYIRPPTPLSLSQSVCLIIFIAFMAVPILIPSDTIIVYMQNGAFTGLLHNSSI